MQQRQLQQVRDEAGGISISSRRIKRSLDSRIHTRSGSSSSGSCGGLQGSLRVDMVSVNSLPLLYLLDGRLTLINRLVESDCLVLA